MAYKPRTAVKTSYGPSGPCKVTFSPDNKEIKLSFKPREGEEPKSYILKIKDENIPDILTPKLIEKHGKTWYVSTAGDVKKIEKIWSVRPLVGDYITDGQHVNFFHPENEPPTPKTNTKFQNPFQYFGVGLGVIEGDFKGVEFPYQYGLHYNFQEWEDDDGVSIVEYSMKGKYTEQLDRFMTAFGVWEKGRMKWKDNLLPTIQKRIQDANKKVRIIVENGFVLSLSPVNAKVAEEDETDDWGETSEPKQEVSDTETVDDFTPTETAVPNEDELPWKEDGKESETDTDEEE